MNTREADTGSTIELRWKGPFRWPGYGCRDDIKSLDDVPIALSCGVYLWTVEHFDGFLIYAAGITRRPFFKRFQEHTRAYRTGIYTIFDTASMKQGIRKVIWPGFWFGERPSEKQDEYDRCSEQIGVAAEELLSSYRVFVAPLDPTPRLLERIEASIMNILYAATGPASVIPDRGMALALRWSMEKPILVRSITPVVLHGLLDEFEA